MSCGQPFFAFPDRSCDSSYQKPVGPYPCSPEFASVKTNFVIPDAGDAVVIDVTSSYPYYVGQGVKIGTGYYQITAIPSTTQLELKHAGLGVTAGAIITAVHPQFGCYQYQIIPVGLVNLSTIPSLVGLNSAANVSVAGALTTISVQKMDYGKIGINTARIQAEVQGTIAGDIYWIGLTLPFPPKADAPNPVFSAYYEDSSYPLPAVARLGNGIYYNYVVVGKGSATLIQGNGRRVVVSGEYETEV